MSRRVRQIRATESCEGHRKQFSGAVLANNSLGTRVNNSNPPRCKNVQYFLHREKGQKPRLRDGAITPPPFRYLITPCRLYPITWGTCEMRLTPGAAGCRLYYSFYSVLASDASTQTKPFNAHTARTDLHYSFNGFVILSFSLLADSRSARLYDPFSYHELPGCAIHFRTA